MFQNSLVRFFRKKKKTKYPNENRQYLDFNLVQKHTKDDDDEKVTTTNASTVGFLEPCTSTTPTKLLRLAAPGISHQQSPIVPHQDILDLLLRLLVDVLLVEGDESFRDGLTDSIDLRGVTSSLDADAHVHAGEAVAAEK